MPQDPFLPLLSLALREPLYAAALALLALPALAFLAAFVLTLCVRRVRVRPHTWLLFLSDFCCCAFAALALAGGALSVLQAVCAALFAKALYLIFCGVLYLPAKAAALHAKRRAKCKAAFASSVREGQPLPAPAAPVSSLPPKVRCFSEGGVRIDRDVRLDHIGQVLGRLRAAPLTAGDRLEAQAAEELVTVYSGKGALQPEEAASLNDVMASLLKMMARYQL